MGGGSPATSTETQTQSGVTDLPAWAKPYFERTLARGETESLKPYDSLHRAAPSAVFAVRRYW
jgi:hypothetical protein